MINTDIAIIGAGASGLAAAITAADSGAGVTLFEKLPRVGKKILATGNGRCNLSNLDLSEDNYYGGKKLLGCISEKYPGTKEFFGRLGLALKSDAHGRIYPHSMSAASVLDALRLAADEKGVSTVCGFNVKNAEKSGKGFIITDGIEKAAAKRIIIACGGKASPSNGSDGGGFILAKRLGHSVTALYPALVPLKTDARLVKPLKGLRVQADAVLYRDSVPLLAQSGEVQFTDDCLSGICIFNLSTAAKGQLENCEIALDIAPELDKKQLFDIISTARSARKSLPCTELLTGLFAKRIGETVLKTALIPFTLCCRDISDEAIKNICDIIKELRFPVTGSQGFDKAQVTGGGISENEVNMLLESEICPGLYFCGEILNIQGLCGGYNLEWAWKSGFTAGVNAARSLKKGDLRND